MNTQYAFTFDANFCSGCKACQAACKDKNNLPVGVLWRRVVEVLGGSWQHGGEAWNQTVFAYNLSISCNHCVYPKCAGVCPVDAYTIRDDGIVFLDTTKCMGCGYCLWACPYGAPQYNADTGYMTKCDFCFDQLDQELPPACVAACPMRVLDYEEITMEQQPGANEIVLWRVPAEMHPYPLPRYSHSRPRLAIKPHAAMNSAAKKSVANTEEIQPRVPSNWEDFPLVLFTLLTQMAVGGFWVVLWTFPGSWAFASEKTTLFGLLPLLTIGICLGAGMLASFTHLGTKKNAWRALGHLRKSWLSREIMFAMLFGMNWLVIIGEKVIWHHSTIELLGLTSAIGLGLIYSMAQVYRLATAPKWNSWRTNAGFIVSALLLGQAAMLTLMAYEANKNGVHVSSKERIIICSGVLLLLLIQFLLMNQRSSQSLFQYVRIGCILLGITLSMMGPFVSRDDVVWITAFLFLAVVIEEVIGRWLFYRSRV